MIDEEESQRLSPGFRCWSCDQPFLVSHVLRDGILRSRAERDGGPYRLYLCPSCTRESLCETTARGRWFASPACRSSFLDYLFSQVLDAERAETLLETFSWLRDHEERRRWYFESDGDDRYRQGSWLRRLWPKAGEESGSPRRPPREGRPRRPEGKTARGGEEAPPRPAARPRILAPHEILGVSPTASPHEVREAFRRLAVQYHPDKVAHLGEEFERVATERFLRLKEAYEALIARRR